MIKLKCKKVSFGSLGDELAFFSWLNSIKCIQKKEYVLDTIILYTKNNISELGLRELLALFFRYKIEMSQLKQFLHPKNADWFKNPGAYWYKKVFIKKSDNKRIRTDPSSPYGLRRDS